MYINGGRIGKVRRINCDVKAEEEIIRVERRRGRRAEKE